MRANRERGEHGTENAGSCSAHSGGPVIHFVIPIHTTTKDNERGHWAKRHTRNKKEREATRIAWVGVGSPSPKPPCAITLIRVASRPLDSQNMGSAMKAVIDELAHCFGWPSDRVEGVDWLPAQQKSPKKARSTSWVEVKIREYPFA